MVQRDLFTLEVQVTARQYARLCQLAQGAQCGVELEKRQGLPYFFLRFRRRYALLAGVALCLVLFAIGSRTVLTIDVGNDRHQGGIISQLRLCGVGAPWPHPIREVENRMMMAMDALSYFS
ncbi:MAG: sporulation protein YqfD [Evtepia gabavorous]